MATTTITCVTAPDGTCTTTITVEHHGTLAAAPATPPPAADDTLAPAGPAAASGSDACILNSFTESPPPSFPHSLDEMTKDWFSLALGANIASLELRPCEEGQVPPLQQH